MADKASAVSRVLPQIKAKGLSLDTGFIFVRLINGVYDKHGVAPNRFRLIGVEKMWSRLTKGE